LYTTDIVSVQNSKYGSEDPNIFKSKEKTQKSFLVVKLLMLKNLNLLSDLIDNKFK
jgi:hypothetical protein